MPRPPPPPGGPDAAWVARPAPAPPIPPRPPARPRVLVADEDALTVRVLRHRFERDGLDVSVAATGTEALRHLAETPPDLAVLNVALDGFELLRRVRAGALGRADLPVALVCWAGNDALVVRGFAAEADDVLVRPFSLAEVSARVRRRLRPAP